MGRSLLALLLLLGLAPAASRAAVQVFVNDQPGFAAANAGHLLMGIEDWSSAGAAPATNFVGPLRPGISTGPFGNGTNPATGLTVQPNIGGSNGSTPNPGAHALFYAPAGFVGGSGASQPSNQVSTNANGDGFDLIFADVGDDVPTAVTFSPMYYRTLGPANSGTVFVEVYDGSNALVAQAAVPNVVDVLEGSFVGLVGEAGEIRRVNLWIGIDAVVGADNIFVYEVPEPDAAAEAVLALLALGALAGRRAGPSRSTR